MTVAAVPATTDEGSPETRYALVGAGETTMPVCVPGLVFFTVSVAVMDCVAAVFNHAEKLWTPLSLLTNV